MGIDGSDDVEDVGVDDTADVDDVDPADGDGAPDIPERGESTSSVWGEWLGSEGETTPRSNGDVKPSSDRRPSTGTSGTSRDRTVLDPDRYLLAGETVVERVDVRRGWVVATSHRLLVFDPESEGSRFETVHRPNVVGVRTTGGGSQRIRAYSLRAVGYAVVLLVSGVVAQALGLPSLFDATPEVGGTPGVGGVMSMLSLVGVLVSLLVDLLFVVGIVAGLVALALVVWYLRGRQPTLVVERADADDIELSLPSDAVGRRVISRVEQAFADELSLSRDA